MRKGSKLAYLAGMIDGDGSLSISIIDRKDWNGFSFQPYAAIGCTDRRVCKWAQHHFGGHLYGPYSKEGCLDMFHWKLYKRSALEILVSDLKPKLYIKTHQANVLQEYFSLGKTFNQIRRMELATKAQWTNDNHHILPPPDRQLISQETMAYLAGVIDAEGGVGIKQTDEGFSCYAKVGNTNPNLIAWINSQFVGHLSIDKYEEETCKDGHNWVLSDKTSIERFLLAVLPYLISKREQANLSLEFIRLGNGWNKAKRTELFHKIAALQVRNRTPETTR